jgi:hypothetical protein
LQYKLDQNHLRGSHFSIGDKSQMPNNQYETTYERSMVLRALPDNNQKENFNFKNSIKISGDPKTDFQTESRAK